MSLKRLWDTTEKKMVFAKWPTWHDCQVWTDEEGSKLYIYDMAQWLEYTPSVSNDGRVYWPQWKPVDWDDEVWFYETNVPTDLYTWESGDEVSYVFKDWDGTVLKEGKVKEWTKPTAPADPTRAATAQYTYTFAWWNPEVAKITKRTTYTATYTATVNQYTATIVSEDTSKWTVDDDSVTADYGTAISANGNVLTIGENTVTATAEEWYEFSSWGTLPETLTEDVTITATFQAVTPTTIPVTAVDLSGQPDIYENVGTTGWTLLSVTPANANDVSTLSVTVANPAICSFNIIYDAEIWVLASVEWLSEWETTAEVFCSWVSQWTINMHISNPQ